MLAVLAIDNKSPTGLFAHRWTPALGLLVLVASLFMVGMALRFQVGLPFFQLLAPWGCFKRSQLVGI